MCRKWKVIYYLIANFHFQLFETMPCYAFFSHIFLADIPIILFNKIHISIILFSFVEFSFVLFSWMCLILSLLIYYYQRYYGHHNNAFLPYASHWSSGMRRRGWVLLHKPSGFTAWTAIGMDNQKGSFSQRLRISKLRSLFVKTQIM